MLYHFYNLEGIYLPKDSCSPSFRLFLSGFKAFFECYKYFRKLPPADTVYKKFMIIANQAFFYCVALHCNM